MNIKGIASILSGFIPVFALHSKTKVFNVKVLIGDAYRELYEQVHPSLGAELNAIAVAVASVFNASASVRNNGYSVSFNLEIPQEHPIVPRLTPALCEGAITNITSLLNDINSIDNTSHTIALIPCPPAIYTEVFRSVNQDVPIVESRINVECAKRVAMFFEANIAQMMASFGNSLLKVLDAPINDYMGLSENTLGDDGVKQNIGINDSTIHSILHSHCFLNTS